MALKLKKTKTKMSDPDTRRHNEDVLSRCEEGDMLEFPRGNINHWGVYVGEGNVIHLTGNDGWSNGEIREDSFWDVAEDSLVKINNFWDKTKAALSSMEIVERARKKVGEAHYNLLWKNCEHFVTWCRYGEGFSEQVKNFVTKFLYGAGATAIVGTVALLFMSFQKKKTKQ